MTRQPTDGPRKDFIRSFDLLIKKITPGQANSTVGFVVLLNDFIAEVRQTGARNLIIAAPYTSPIFERKIKTWTIQYILPQMQNSGIRRIAFVMQERNTALSQIIHISKKGFEVGIFASLSGATAWIMNMTTVAGRTRTCDTLDPKRCPEITSK